ncbi:MAG: DNA (cytosine-5-)-methyltransferase [Oscillospiraceae bacterium]|nr:DNA (cytosine-5-)-methyltransferase [Oscillospiraceae bacterium]
MEIDWITPQQAAEQWNISSRQVQTLCSAGHVKGAVKLGRVWLIPKDADKPIDYRTKEAHMLVAEPAHGQTSIFGFWNNEVADKATDINRDPRMVSLFSGCGGLDLGFKQSGFNVVWANDFDADAQAVYDLNVEMDEVKIDPRDILTIGEDEIPEADIITAGFPCQPFSNAGSRKGVHDSRGMLYKECLRIIEKIMPKVILFENVKGLLSTDYIDGRNLADVIMDDLSNMSDTGYNVVYQLVNASDYGVPQNRQRVIFIGIRKDLNKAFVFPDKLPKENLNIGNVLDLPQDVPNQVHWELSPQALEMISYIPEGGSWKNVPYEHLAPRFQKIRDEMKKYHSPNFYRRFARTEICGTITASAQPENCGIVHPTENRRYTIREIARIQTFPDTFRFIDDTPRDVTAMYKVIGNAVPVNLAKCIAGAIMQQVFAEEK